jgi:hypothetical protein
MVDDEHLAAAVRHVGLPDDLVAEVSAYASDRVKVRFESCLRYLAEAQQETRDPEINRPTA